jgi:hypothetical protein
MNASDEQTPDDELIRLLSDDKRCPLCSVSFGADAMRVTLLAGGSIALELTCGTCGSSSNATLLLNNASLSADLTPGEVFRFSQRPPILERDRVHIRELLQRHRGDLIDLI